MAKTYIYESPDHGNTVYRREVNTNVRETYKLWDIVADAQKEQQERELWKNIFEAAKTNPTLQDALDKCKVIYRLSEKQDGI